MLDEYKEMCRLSADMIPDWKNQSKNDLCRAYVTHKNNAALQNAYFSAVLYRYWHLIAKYYYMSANCATPEDCYEWLVDSVACCLNLASWENPESSIYKDPNGPDKVINRCMKCARLTFYQFINRKKRRDNFGLLSIDELKELFGNGVHEPTDYSQELNASEFIINNYVIERFHKKDYFQSFLISCVLSSNVFDVTKDDSSTTFFEVNLRKLVKMMNTLDEDFLYLFSKTYQLDYADVKKAYQYVKAIPVGAMRKKVTQTLEDLKHSSLITQLVGGNYAD